MCIWLFVCMYVCLFVFLFICPSIYLIIWLSACLSICLFVCLHLSVCRFICVSINLSVCLFICQSIYVFLSLSIYVTVCSFGCQSFHPTVSIPLYLPVYLSICASLPLCLPACRYVFMFVTVNLCLPPLCQSANLSFSHLSGISQSIFLSLSLSINQAAHDLSLCFCLFLCFPACLFVYSHLSISRWFSVSVSPFVCLFVFPPVSALNSILIFTYYYQWYLTWFNRTALTRYQGRKTTVLSCHRCLISTGVEKMNNI